MDAIEALVIAAILEILDEEVDRYRTCGAPMALYSEGDSVMARIGSCEVRVVVQTEDGAMTGLGFETKPWVKGLRESVEVRGLDHEEVAEVVRSAFVCYTRRLAQMKVHPFCQSLR